MEPVSEPNMLELPAQRELTLERLQHMTSIEFRREWEGGGQIEPCEAKITEKCCFLPQ